MPNNDYFEFIEEEAAQAEWDARLEARRRHWNDGMDVYTKNLIARSRRVLDIEPEDYVI